MGKKQKKQKKKKNRKPAEAAPETSTQSQETPYQSQETSAEEKKKIFRIRDLTSALILKVVYSFPVKYLQQLRCFSKFWLSLIDHQAFRWGHIQFNLERSRELICNNYHDRARRKLVALLGAHGPPTRLLDIDLGFSERPNWPRRINFGDFSKNMVLAGSISGIVCLTHSAEMRDRYVALWNPTIRYWKPIAFPENRYAQPLIWKYVSVGLGFEEESQDFKIMCVVPFLPIRSWMIGQRQVVMYSTNRDSWMYADYVAFSPKKHNCDLIVGGVPYWVATYGDSQTEVLGKIDTRGFSFMYFFPEHIKNEDTKVYAVNLRGSIAALIHSPGEVPNSTIDLYVLDALTTDWTRAYTIGPIQVPLRCLVQCCSTGEFVIETGTGFLDNASSAYQYFWDPTTNDVFRNSEIEELNPIWRESYSHVESLIRLPGMVEIAKENACRRTNIGEKNILTDEDRSSIEKEFGPYF